MALQSRDRVPGKGGARQVPTCSVREGTCSRDCGEAASSWLSRKGDRKGLVLSLYVATDFPSTMDLFGGCSTRKHVQCNFCRRFGLILQKLFLEPLLQAMLSPRARTVFLPGEHRRGGGRGSGRGGIQGESREVGWGWSEKAAPRNCSLNHNLKVSRKEPDGEGEDEEGRAHARCHASVG